MIRKSDARLPAALVADVERMIWQDLFRRGMLPDEVDNYRQTANWFPWLRERPETMRLRLALPAALQTGTACEPQIVVHPPDDHAGDLEPHIDTPPDWATGREFARIIGVAITPQLPANGGIWMWDANPGEHGASRRRPIYLEPGDYIVFGGDDLHASGWNITAAPRIAVYYRYLKP